MVKNIKVYNVKGMHCSGCKAAIEKNIGKINGIESVEANVKKGTVCVKGKIDDKKIKTEIENTGYEVIEDIIDTPWISRDKNDYVIFGITCILGIGVYLVLQHFGILGNTGISGSSLSYGLIILIGITAGFSSCMALIGGLVAAISSNWNINNNKTSFKDRFVPHIWFNIGRVIGFGLFGGLLGLLGGVINLSPTFMVIMMLIVGIIMLILGINLSNLFPKLSTYLILPINNWLIKKEDNITGSKNKYFGALISGGLTFFLPCGFTFAMQIYALGTGSFWTGMIVMALFAVGTIPGLLGVGTLTSIFKGKAANVFYKVLGAIVILVGAFNIINASQNLFMGDKPSFNNQNQVETIEMIYTKNGLKPNTITLEQGKKYNIIVDVQTTNYGCMSTINLPGLDTQYQNVIEGNKLSFFVDAKEKGEYTFKCTMGMSHNAKVIIK